MEQPRKNSTPAPSATAPKGEEYFFSGGLEFLPITVIASSREEAEEKWKAARIPVGGAPIIRKPVV